jgi:hypothetical protein
MINAHMWLKYWIACHAAYKADDKFSDVLRAHKEDRYVVRKDTHPEVARARHAYHGASQRMHDTLRPARDSGPRWPVRVDKEGV